MGRQAHMTRLALGRSPYGPPLRDENGDLILGPHTYDDDARGYVQQFDDKGHPTSKATDLHNKRLRRAQNEVLKLAGVVRSKNDETQPDEWKLMGNEERKKLVNEENELIRFVRLFDNITLDLITIPIYAFRHRLMTFKSYLGPPVFSMLQSEKRILGLRETLFCGLPLSIYVGLSQRSRTLFYALPHYRSSLLTVRSKYQHLAGSQYHKLGMHLWELLWFAIEWPFATGASLQALHILSSSAILGPHTILSILSIFLVDQVPTFPQSLTPTNIGAFCVSCLGHPFIMSYLFDQIRESLQSGIHAIIRFRLPVPDEPDSLSNSARPTWCDEDHLRAQLPGFGYDLDAKRMYCGPKTFSESIRMAFPGLSKILYTLTGFPAILRAHLTPESEVPLKNLCDLRYGDLWRENRQFTEALRLPDSVIRRRAVEEALARAGIDPAQDSISIEAWARAIPDRLGEGSTATPDPLDLFSVTDGNELDSIIHTDAQRSTIPQERPTALHEENRTSEAEAPQPGSSDFRTGDNVGSGQAPDMMAGNDPEEFQPMLPLETLLLPVDPADPVPQEAGLSVPIPGVNRAMSLEQVLPRPVRRPTEVGVDFDSDLFTLPNRPIELTSPAEKVFQEPDEPIRHRVTLLSNYPGEILALHASALITSIIMLPFDTLYNRRLANIFYGSSRIKGQTSRRLLNDVLPTNSFSGNSRMRLRDALVFASNLILTFEVQAAISTLVWKGVQWSVLCLGQEYGWGKI